MRTIKHHFSTLLTLVFFIFYLIDSLQLVQDFFLEPVKETNGLLEETLILGRDTNFFAM